MSFIGRLCDMIGTQPALSAEERGAVVMSFEDTVAVMYAGWSASSAVAARRIFADGGARLLDGSYVQSPEHAALVHGIAGHALDYDDVQLTSVTHPSIVLVAALMAMCDARPNLAPRMIDAYAVGLGANIALGEVLGFEHYDRGWHATSTIGPLSAAAALAYLLELEGPAVRSALALAAAQAGGFQRNFGTEAKHVQAGQAAAAGLRSVLMAEAGIAGCPDIFGERGFFDLYGGASVAADPDKVEIAPNALSVSRKLFPCCYLTHRMIGAALAARRTLGAEMPEKARIVLRVPYGGMRPLHVTDPQNGAEAKFCATYCTAVALAQGTVGLQDFEDSAVFRPDIRNLMARIEVIEDALEGDMPVGVDHGTVRLQISAGGQTLAEAEAVFYPGAPQAPATPEAFDAKVSDCLSIWHQQTGQRLTLADFRRHLHEKICADAAHCP
ncbi:MmgE/PrpD family protein [Pontivivens nitratireducens]|uniref:MmgE/PrpD family protein n=1 Tax=Pontivivens nitratireducens TaxID=2758038 RepID=A0A6G7VQ55_9RHOB|nr:MmgE/PrpD family protein [Pontibrevibacter nitratireducens]QIK42213.1 MmgE/PrpD family protein [Pontibrevibacter nitratireducens]